MKQPLVLVLCLLCSCDKPVAPAAPPPAAAPTKVSVVPVQTGSLAQTYSSRAEVLAANTAQVVSSGTGQVLQLYFEPGTPVRAHQRLALLATEGLELDQSVAEVQLTQAQLALEDTLSRQRRRHMARQTSQALVRDEEWESLTLDVQRKRAQEQAAVMAVKKAQLAVTQATVRAPVAGVMQTRRVQLGQYVTPGTSLGELAQEGAARLQFFVPDAVASQIKPHDRVSWGARGDGATVTFIARQASDVSRQVPVQAQVDKGATMPRPGVSVPVRVALPLDDHALSIPRRAVVPYQHGLCVFVIKDAKAQRCPVTLGPGEGDQVRVIEGLAADDAVIVQGQEGLFDGAAVVAGDAR